MLLQLLDCLEKGQEISTRREAILKVENKNKIHLIPIKSIKKNLEEAQLAKLYNKFEKRKIRAKLYNAKNELLSDSDASRWLKERNIRPRN
ncbi:hypothetical protein CWI36_3421p0010 [Hamiltosporidium magnivora]|uniref:Uncharacterized protein n=1 Tax=Hamiltosporidium magnivora TaxID=148818 RepID=A0A4Q9KRH2_9MICR|nr:hypothetical protein CWI36_3421p0010 [Hamiltosporidium magnivora]